MKHLIVCREYPPAPYPPGGIGTYVRHIARLLAESGEIVHIVAQRWEGAPLQVTESCSGRLVVHRISLHEAANTVTDRIPSESQVLSGLAVSDCPSLAFSWQVAKIVESLVKSEAIDVIEAPEWEAPLYYFQIRRAIGLGPSRQPPCLIHLHSPSELIFRHNQWDVTLSDYQPLRRLEEYTVRAADAVLCPSRYLAQEAGQLFGLAADAIRVIPYPLGDTTSITRDRRIWERDAICYAGRLELRKGVVEWVEAAVEVAQSHSKVEFEFIGSDTSLSGGAGRSVRDYLNGRIPRPLRSRFHFYGSQTRRKLMELLSKVPMAVVPSRWENLPYSCIEAMCTGLPVLVSPTGGMAELLTDGESGWVAADGTASGLASALRRMLNTPSFERARMGSEAEKAVRRICSNESVLERHLELRRRMALTGASRSRQVPSSAGIHRVDANRRGIGVVVTCLDRPDLLPACLQSIRRQTQTASVVVVATAGHPEVPELIEHDAPQGAPVVLVNAPSARLARDLGVQRILRSTPLVRGIAFLTEGARLEPHYLSACESVLELQPGVGVVSSIVRYDSPGIELDAAPCPASSQVPLDFDALACVAVRAEALQSAPDAGETWAAVTYPDLLVSATRWAHRATNAGRSKRYSAMALAQRGSAQITLNWFLAAPLAEKARWIVKILKHPLRTAQWAAWQLRAAAGRAQ